MPEALQNGSRKLQWQSELRRRQTRIALGVKTVGGQRAPLLVAQGHLLRSQTHPLRISVHAWLLAVVQALDGGQVLGERVISQPRGGWRKAGGATGTEMQGSEICRVPPTRLNRKERA